MYIEMRNIIKEYIKQADDRFETLAYLNALLFSIVFEIQEEEKKENKSGNQSQAGLTTGVGRWLSSQIH